MDDLTEALRSVQLQLTNIDVRLQRLENTKNTGIQPTSTQSVKPQNTSIPPKVDNTYRPAPNFIPESKKTSVTRQYDSSSILGVIGIFFVILAGVFFIRMTIESGWLTPSRQVLLAAATGLLMFVLPHFLPDTEKDYGALLSGAGITVMHLAWFGAYSLHALIEPNTALVCATVIGVISLFAKLKDGQLVFFLVAMTGTYLAVPLIGYKTQDMTVVSVFLIVWNISFTVAGLSTAKREIIFIASYLGTLTILFLSSLVTGHEAYFELLQVQIIQFTIFAAGLVYFSKKENAPLSEDESFALLPALLIFYATTYKLIEALYPSFAEWFGICFGAFLLGVYLLAGKLLPQADLASRNVLTSCAMLAFVHSIFFQLISETSKPFFGLIFGLAVLLSWKFYPETKARYKWPGLILLGTFLIGAVLTIDSKDDGQIFVMNFAYGTVALAGVLLNTFKTEPNKEAGDFSKLLLIFAHFEVMLGLYRLSKNFSGLGALFVTITWGLYAAFVLGAAFYRQDKTLGNSALLILLGVSMKAFFYDLSNTGNMTRVLCLFAEGLFLYGCGWIFKKVKQWT